jgi:hypothetical protein
MTAAEQMATAQCIIAFTFLFAIAALFLDYLE